jgi:hypothetical protein
VYNGVSQTPHTLVLSATKYHKQAKSAAASNKIGEDSTNAKSVGRVGRSVPWQSCYVDGHIHWRPERFDRSDLSGNSNI